MNTDTGMHMTILLILLRQMTFVPGVQSFTTSRPSARTVRWYHRYSRLASSTRRTHKSCAGGFQQLQHVNAFTAFTSRNSFTTSTTTSSSSSSLFLQNKHYPQSHKESRIRIRCFTSKQNTSDNHDSVQVPTTVTPLTKEEQQERINTLHNALHELHIDGHTLAQALQTSLTTMEGFDHRFGKSAIKTYKTFIDPRPSKVEQVRAQNVQVAALRCANQIDFLIKRHRSHETEWVRHTDTRDGDNHHGEDEGEPSQKDGRLDETKKRFPIIILLDNVRSAFNVGSIFRTADACNCAHILTTGITPSPNGRGKEKLAKSALGADRQVPSKHFATTRGAMDYLREEMEGWTIIGMETTDQSKCYTEVAYPGKGLHVVQQNESSISEGVVLVLGNEVTGVDTEIMPLLDLIVEIPMFGTKNSLNIAACAPVVLYEILRQWDAVNDESLSIK